MHVELCNVDLQGSHRCVIRENREGKTEREREKGKQRERAREGKTERESERR